MRISDWSSVVCSSDLQVIVDMKWSGGKKYPEKLANNRHLQLMIYGGLLQQDTGKWQRYAYYLLEAATMLTHERDVFARAQAEAPQELQIERATCRERVCQYV